MSTLILRLLREAVPIIVMIGLIPFFTDDTYLAAIYILMCALILAVRRDKHDLIFFAFGFMALFISEYFFVSTGVEVFLRNSLLGIMPLWLPILWGYAFVAIRRSIGILEDHLK
ncbi:MAG: hypothetical protein RLZZ416_766 [Candidatus Parcubacteria bacterium]|jgi:hypothetical protein